MKKLFFIALILISFQGIGQVYQYLPQYGYQMNRIQADSVLKIPSDTIRNKSGIARIGTTIYAGNGTYWTAVSGGSSYWQSSTTNNIDNTNSGNVGIGNTNPQYKLDVTGTINSTGNISTSQTVSANGGLEVVESFVPKVTLKNQSGYGGYMNLRNTGNQQKVNISSYEDNYINQPLAVGNNSVDASAQLDITASSKGILIPRLTTTQRNAITTPATGLLIWNTTDSTLQQYRGLSGWSAIGGGSISAPSGEIVYGTGGGTTSSSELSYSTGVGGVFTHSPNGSRFLISAADGSYIGDYDGLISGYLLSIVDGNAIFSNSANNYLVGINKTPSHVLDINGAVAINKDSVARQTSTKWKLAIDTTTGLIVRDSTGGGSTYSAGYGLSLATNTFSVDSLQLSTKAFRVKGTDSLGAITALKSTTLSNGWGLLGGGDLSANRTYTADTVNLSTKANGTKQKDSVVSLLSSYLPLSGGTYTTTSGNGLALTTSTLTTGNLMKLTNTSTVNNGAGLLSIVSSGANGTASKTTYGQQISVTNTGTTSTNVGLNVTASGASNNYAALFTGNVGIGITTPSYPLHISSGSNTEMRLTSTNNTSFISYGISATGINGFLYGFGTAYSTSGRFKQASVLLDNDGAGGVSLSATNAAGIVAFYTGGTTEKARFAATGNLLINTTTDNSTLTVNGSFATAYVAKTANYTATASDYTIDATSGTFTVTLPTAVGIQGREYVVKNSGTGSITVNFTSGQTADGAASYTLGTQYKYVKFQSNNATWIITANN